MQNLNDYYHFVQVVKYQGFTKASENLGITKSKLSRRISDLEERLGVRLIQRNTRKFTVTELGQKFYEYCLQILHDVDAAEDFVKSALSDEPSGLIKLSCPIALVEILVGDLVANFMQQHPQVQVHLMATNRRIDLIEEGVDLAIRVRNTALEDSDLIVRDLDAWAHVLVASPSLFKTITAPTTLADIGNLPSIGFQSPKQSWHFKNDEGVSEEIEISPRLKTDNFSAMKSAVNKGVGIASLPEFFVIDEIKSGQLITLLPEWHLPKGVIHVAYPSRQGLLPAMRLLLEYLIAQFKLRSCENKHVE